MRRVVVRRAHQVPDAAPVWLAVGTAVEVGQRHEEWTEFVFVTSADGGTGWIPARYLSRACGTAVVEEAYDTTELATEVGDLLDVVYDDAESGWLWCRSSTGREGWVPSKTVETAVR